MLKPRKAPISLDDYSDINGTKMITIREADENDAAALIELRNSLYKETEFLLFRARGILTHS